MKTLIDIVINKIIQHQFKYPVLQFLSYSPTQKTLNNIQEIVDFLTTILGEEIREKQKENTHI